MDRVTKQKAVDGLVEFFEDIRCICGKREGSLEGKLYMKNYLLKSDLLASISPIEVQYFANYADIPIEPRRSGLNKIFFKFAAEYADLELRLLYYVMWRINEGLTVAEVKQELEQYFGSELANVLPWESLEFDKFPSLALYPGSIAGANARLRNVLNQRSVKQGKDKSDYEQDLSVVLWECSEGKHLEEFRKSCNSKGNFTEEAASKLFKGEENEKLRGIILRILRKTIEDLPDIRQDIRNLRAQGKEVMLTDEMLSALPARHEQYENAIDNFLDMITERGIEISRLDARDLDLLNDELSRLESGYTRREYYGDKENQRKQQLKYLAKRLKT